MRPFWKLKLTKVWQKIGFENERRCPIEEGFLWFSHLDKNLTRDSDKETSHKNRWLFTLQKNAQSRNLYIHKSCVIGVILLFSAKINNQRFLWLVSYWLSLNVTISRLDVPPSKKTKKLLLSWQWPPQKCVTWILPMMLAKIWKVFRPNWKKEPFLTQKGGKMK